MNEEMDGWMNDGWNDEWMDGWINGEVKKDEPLLYPREWISISVWS